MSEQCGKLRGTIQTTGALAGRMSGKGALAGAVAIPQVVGGASSWDTLPGKPFDTIGAGLKVVGRALEVDTTNAVEQDNTKPITAAAVYAEVGNINALLATI